MRIDIFRLQHLSDSTPGKLSIDGIYQCVTLELPWNEGQNRHDTDCILPGTYNVAINFSPHFQRDMMEIMNVPGRDGIRIHVANLPTQLLGCVAVGTRAAEGYIEASQMAYDALYPKVQAALKAGERVTVEIHAPEVQ